MKTTKATRAKKTAVPIPAPGSKSVDPLLQAKQAIESKIATVTDSTTVSADVEVDDHNPSRKNYKVVTHNGRPLSVYLMWSDLKENHNKFYII